MYQFRYSGRCMFSESGTHWMASYDDSTMLDRRSDLDSSPPLPRWPARTQIDTLGDISQCSDNKIKVRNLPMVRCRR